MMFRKNSLGWEACSCKHCKSGRGNKAWKGLHRTMLRREDKRAIDEQR